MPRRLETPDQHTHMFLEAQTCQESYFPSPEIKVRNMFQYKNAVPVQNWNGTGMLTAPQAFSPSISVRDLSNEQPHFNI